MKPEISKGMLTFVPAVAQAPIAHDHGDLNVLAFELRRALEARDMDRFQRHSWRLFREVSKHSQEEEGREGWYAEVERTTPRLISTLAKLRDEHKEILTELKALCSDDEKDFEMLTLQVRDLFNLLIRHEKHEEKIIRELFYSDIGISD